MDHVRVLCVEVNGALVVGGRPSPCGVGGTAEIRKTTESNLKGERNEFIINAIFNAYI